MVCGRADCGTGTADGFLADLAGDGASGSGVKARAVRDRDSGGRAAGGGARKRWRAARVLQRVPASCGGGGDRIVRAGLDSALSISRMELRLGWDAQGNAGVRWGEELRPQGPWAGSS